MNGWHELLASESFESTIQEFYRRVFADVMIGYMFTNVDFDTIVKNQIAFTSNLFGRNVTYQGKSLRDAHQKLSIKSGQFRRRQVILRETLAQSHLPDDFVGSWLKKEELLRSQIIKNLDVCANI